MEITESPYPFAETLARLRTAIGHRGLTIFAEIDHSEAAGSVGLELPDELVIVFGNPRAGTPLMRADPTVGIELPLRILLWAEDVAVRLGYRDPKALAQTYQLGEQAPALEAMSALMGDLVSEVSST